MMENKIGDIKLFRKIVPERFFDDFILLQDTQKICQEIIYEHANRNFLRNHNLEPRNLLLLLGYSGNGKLSIAEAFALALSVPLFFVHSRKIFKACPEESIMRLEQLLSVVSKQDCVLFFDEIESLESVGSYSILFLRQISKLPSGVIVIGAGRRADLLDPVLLEQFQVCLSIEKPSDECLAEWVTRFQKRCEVLFGCFPEILIQRLRGLSFVEIEMLGTDILRKHILGSQNFSIQKTVDRVFEEQNKKHSIFSKTLL